MATAVDSLEEGPEDLPPWRRAVPLILAMLLVLALGLIIYLANRASEERDHALALQRHSFEVMMLADELDGTIAYSEALLARYVVSLDPDVGRQFQAEWRQAQAELNALERATRDNPEQRANVARLRAAVETRGETLNDIALRTSYQQKLGALARFYAAGKSPAVEQMRAALQKTIDHEKLQLDRSNQLVDRSEARVSRFNDSYALIGLGLLAAALLALWFAYIASRERRFARRLALAEAARVDGLEIAVRDRTEQLQNANAQLRREMDEHARAEQDLRQLQKMDAIGQLTGGIAHDFNNMLAVIVNGIELARQALRRDPAKAQRHLDSAMEGATRAASLTSRLLAYARREPLLAQSVDVDALVMGMRDLIDRAMDERIAVVLDLDANGWLVWVEQAQLENALLNLALNARDAMATHGTLTIATRHATLAAGAVGQCAAGDHVCLAVTDTGSGMTPDVIERAFEPFFTTKPVGKGTGLGLSQIFSFVRQSGGAIDVTSRPGQGTTIRLCLPRYTGEASAAPEALAAAMVVPSSDGRAAGSEPPAPVAPDGLTVLVVEDDPRVLRSTLFALETLGYKGISCDHPRKAAALLAEHPDIALILSDVLMPDMTGPEMIAALGEAARHKPVIFVTGFAGDSERAAQVANVPILGKPFTLAQLAHSIDEALGGLAKRGAAAPVR